MRIENYLVDEFNDEIKRLIFDYIHTGNDEYFEQALKMIEEFKKRQLPTDESE